MKRRTIPNPPPADTIEPVNPLEPPHDEPLRPPPIGGMCARDIAFISSKSREFNEGFRYNRKLVTAWQRRAWQAVIKMRRKHDVTPEDILVWLRWYLEQQAIRCDARPGGAGK